MLFGAEYEIVLRLFLASSSPPQVPHIQEQSDYPGCFVS